MNRPLECQKHQQKIEFFCPIKNIQNVLQCFKCLKELKQEEINNMKKFEEIIDYSNKQQQIVIQNFENIINNIISDLLDKSEKITQALQKKYYLDKQKIMSLNYNQTQNYLEQLIAVDHIPKDHMQIIENTKIELLNHFEKFYQYLDIKQCSYAQVQEKDIIESQQLFQQGKQIIQQGSEETFQQRKIVGLDCMKQALEKNPNNIECLLYLGENSLNQQNYNEALKYFEQILNLEPYNINALKGKAEVYRKQQQFQEALQLSKTILGINPNDIDSKLVKAQCYLYKKQKDLEKARKIYQQTVDQNPNNPKALFGLGDSFRLLGKDDEAILQFRKSLSIDPKNVESFSAMGDCYRLKKDYANAERCFNEALQLQPKHEKTLERFGDFYRMQNRFQQAISYYQKVLELNSNNEWANQQIRICQNRGLY